MLVVENDGAAKVSPSKFFVVETKGLQDLDVPPKMRRLKQWCEDVNAGQNRVHYDFVFVEEEDFRNYRPKPFAALVTTFKKYK